MKSFYLIITVTVLILLSGCRERGPAEEAGRSIDDAAERAAENIEELCEGASEALAAELDC